MLQSKIFSNLFIKTKNLCMKFVLLRIKLAEKLNFKVFQSLCKNTSLLFHKKKLLPTPEVFSMSSYVQKKVVAI